LGCKFVGKFGYQFTRPSKYFEEEDELIIKAVVDLMEGNWIKADQWFFH
jgi:hypothetical protein